MGLEHQLQPKLELARQISRGERKWLLDLVWAGGLDAVQSFKWPGQRIEKLSSRGQRQPIIKHVADLVEVRAIENVGAGGDEVHLHTALAVDVDRFDEGEVRGGVSRAAIGITRDGKGRGEVLIQSGLKLMRQWIDDVRQAWCPY